MQAFYNIIIKIISNPKVEAFVIIGATSLLRKMFMDQNFEDKLKTKEPLFLPRGSVRAIITLLLSAVVAGSFFLHYEVSQEFIGLTVFAIGYYIGYRTDNTQLPEIKQ